jgi:hypothetical protein
MIANLTAGTHVRQNYGANLTGRLTGEVWEAPSGTTAKIVLDPEVAHLTASGTINSSIEFLTEIINLADKYREEAEMFLKVYDWADTNDGACRVAEAAKGMCKLHAKYDAGFGQAERDEYMAIVFRTLHAARAGR